MAIFQELEDCMQVSIQQTFQMDPFWRIPYKKITLYVVWTAC